MLEKKNCQFRILCLLKKSLRNGGKINIYLGEGKPREVTDSKQPCFKLLRQEIWKVRNEGTTVARSRQIEWTILVLLNSLNYI